MALLLRLGAAVWLQDRLDHHWHRAFLIEGDAEGYWELANKIVAGEDYAIHDPPRYALRMPGFPAVLAVSILLFGQSMFAARLLMAVLGTCCCWLVYCLGRDVKDSRTGLIAGGFASILPVFVGFSVTLLSETTFALTMLLSLLAGNRLYISLVAESRSVSRTDAIKSSRSKAFFFAVATGVAIAAGCYVKPSWLLAAPIVATLLVLCSRQKLQALTSGVIVIATMLLCLLPWGIRNQQMTGHFTFTTFWMGASLYDGLNPDAKGDSDMRFFDKDQLALHMSEYEVDQHYKKAALKFVKEHPVQTLKLGLIKLGRFWKPWPNAGQFNSLSSKLAVAVFFVPIYLGALIGAWRCKNDIWSLAICAGPILYFSAIHAVFVGSLRYRLPAEYPLLILTAVGIQLCWDRFLKHQE